MPPLITGDGKIDSHHWETVLIFFSANTSQTSWQELHSTLIAIYFSHRHVKSIPRYLDNKKVTAQYSAENVGCWTNSNSQRCSFWRKYAMGIFPDIKRRKKVASNYFSIFWNNLLKVMKCINHSLGIWRRSMLFHRLSILIPIPPFNELIFDMPFSVSKVTAQFLLYDQVVKKASLRPTPYAEQLLHSEKYVLVGNMGRRHHTLLFEDQKKLELIELVLMIFRFVSV